jgi:hypothetical protein
MNKFLTFFYLLMVFVLIFYTYQSMAIYINFMVSYTYDAIGESDIIAIRRYILLGLILSIVNIIGLINCIINQRNKKKNK